MTRTSTAKLMQDADATIHVEAQKYSRLAHYAELLERESGVTVKASEAVVQECVEKALSAAPVEKSRPADAYRSILVLREANAALVKYVGDLESRTPGSRRPLVQGLIAETLAKARAHSESTNLLPDFLGAVNAVHKSAPNLTADLRGDHTDRIRKLRAEREEPDDLTGRIRKRRRQMLEDS